MNPSLKFDLSNWMELVFFLSFSFLSWDQQDGSKLWSDISIASVSHTLDMCFIVNAVGPKVNSRSLGLLDSRGTNSKRKGQEGIVAYELMPLIHPILFGIYK